MPKVSKVPQALNYSHSAPVIYFVASILAFPQLLKWEVSLLHGKHVPCVVQKAPARGGVECVFSTWPQFLGLVPTQAGACSELVIAKGTSQVCIHVVREGEWSYLPD
jgi:hypothetical protein